LYELFLGEVEVVPLSRQRASISVEGMGEGKVTPV
jgi:hypothetical protein